MKKKFKLIGTAVLVLLLLNPPPVFRPKRDAAVLGLTLPALCLAGFLVSLAAAVTGSNSAEAVPSPSGLTGWIAAILLSLSTGFLEEAYFRVYLPQRILGLNLNRLSAFVISGLVFALCHTYGGPWSFANALLAAFVLSLAYIKSSSFLGIAVAHGLYNIFVFLTVTLEW